ncbi:TetR family transcriptional regulator C-terminal domain-containing protein [Pseudonocardia sp. DSM 110487]|uniref:TetR/AcrR family transcriptional regulator n=1 Tax=Pseudonocardia sp. DSM 110487 TaxID=2865833 RepID=UPI001C696301|nr:TetR family transcriptional regulator C-terminal domain-containing protein [Pseudonocardia sp. DSM 110487]QYN34189.1 TetR family transcriptional regulator C-terminal domain-containing protein [Pseudonocardia sp. DSM 110487]
MPRRVDHDARRREIADAVLRLAATEGLESVSLRHVAAEAGISMGRVQHYFRSKDEMLVFAFEYQSRRHEQRIVEKLTAAGRPPTIRDVVRTVIVEILPTDASSRASWLAGIAFFIRAMSDDRMAAVVAAGGPGLIEFLAERLAAADLAQGVDPRHEAVILWALIDSQATAIVLGGRTPAEAVATVDYHLDRVFSR